MKKNIKNIKNIKNGKLFLIQITENLCRFNTHKPGQSRIRIWAGIP